MSKITLFNMAEYTKQQIFEQAMNHLIDQGGPAAIISEQGSVFCLYRNRRDDGTCRMCIVGAMIPDEKYDERIESSTASAAFIRLGVSADPFLEMPELTVFIEDLQGLHDVAARTSRNIDCAFFDDLLCALEDTSFISRHQLHLPDDIRRRIALQVLKVSNENG